GQDLNIESIREIEIITAGAPPEFSRAQGGFVNVVTRSGGNDFQGMFKLYLRTSRLDGDGAGQDPGVLHGSPEAGSGVRDGFTDLRPFVSLSGPILRDRLWYYLASEFIQIETPVNLGAESFVDRTRGHREFGKITWQIRPTQKLGFSLLFDRTREENQGLDSLTRVESGYTFQRGGPTYALRGTSVFRPDLLLESTLSWFDNGFRVTPTLDPDTNHNGLQSVDGLPLLGGNRDGIDQAKEHDPGEDWDQDGAYDIFEDENGNSRFEPSEDRDLDGRLTPRGGCEGQDREDQNCNGTLDREMDRNFNGVVDPEEDQGIPCAGSAICSGGVLPDTAGNGKLDSEDANGNGRLDVVGDSGLTSFPFWTDRDRDGLQDAEEFRSPLPADRQYVYDAAGRISGPYPYQFEDARQRLTLKEELSSYVGELAGSHDLKLGISFEREEFARDTLWRPFLDIPPPTMATLPRDSGTLLQTAVAYMGFPGNVRTSASAKNLGFYLQDRYKPLPTLTLGIGVRVDIERLDGDGYAPFDPWAERADFDTLTALFASTYNSTPGLCRDPLYSCTSSSAPLPLAQLFSALATIAPTRFTRHQAQVDFQSSQINSLLGRTVTLQSLLDAGVRPRRREPVRIENANVAPRVSLAWDPRGDGKAKVFASWGRFYDKLFLGAIVREQGPDQFSRVYFLDEDGVDPSGHPNNRLGDPLVQSPPSAFQVDRRLATPHTDELSVGFARELAPELSLQISYLRRDYRNQLQDRDVNHRTRTDPGTGRLVDRIGRTQCIVAPSGVQCLFVGDGMPDLYSGNLFFNRILRIGNTNRQEYRGLEIELARRLRRRWQMEASYTLARAQGDAESYLSELGNDPSVAEFERGFLDYDQRHAVKFNAIAFLPRDWQVGGTARWSSGLPYSAIATGSSQDDSGYSQYRIVYGYTDSSGAFVSERRNSHRNAAAYDFNARVQKSFVLGKASAKAFLEVFNLLNDDTLRIYTWEPGVSQLQLNEERRFGRRFQLGFQVGF
ncbi:MAG TPA: TonB-dependent receptor, partial [Candidatus Polarisedimenticolia bacterium]|nr:TonB-dependent receptor [Candidatus Polarisedimenticolia bacterium]